MIEDILGIVGVYGALALLLVVCVLGPAVLILTGHQDLFGWFFGALLAFWVARKTLFKAAPGSRRP
ncbi:MAG TPA: hypothetical protein VK595_15875 [Vicinamibacterales bacterium]|nr:hypothetical protein [Vicinamibacterales bacterium]